MMKQACVMCGAAAPSVGNGRWRARQACWSPAALMLQLFAGITRLRVSEDGGETKRGEWAQLSNTTQMRGGTIA